MPIVGYILLSSNSCPCSSKIELFFITTHCLRIMIGLFIIFLQQWGWNYLGGRRKKRIAQSPFISFALSLRLMPYCQLLKLWIILHFFPILFSYWQHYNNGLAPRPPWVRRKDHIYYSLDLVGKIAKLINYAYIYEWS